MFEFEACDVFEIRNLLLSVTKSRA